MDDTHCMPYKAKPEALQLFKMCESIFAKYGDASYIDKSAAWAVHKRSVINEHYDAMQYQIRGLRTSHDDVWNDELWTGETHTHEQQAENWDTFLDEAEATHKWFTHVAEIMKLQISIPETIYG